MKIFRLSTRMRASVLAVIVLVLAAPVAPASHKTQLSWELTPTGSESRLRGLDAVSRRVAWTSGSEGTVLRTLDGGTSWENVSPPDTADLQFRDVEAFGRDRAHILAIGPGAASRIYRTTDGGESWTLTFQNEEEAAFYDCMAFFNSRRGLALSDPVDGKFRIITTDNGGRSWDIVPDDGMPDALAGEFAFAASGTCLVAGEGRHAWFGTGGTNTGARVFRTRDGGENWSVATTPVRSTESGGIFSLAFVGHRRGLAVGGDFLTPNEAVDALALTFDGGVTWKLVDEDDAPDGYRSGSAWVPHRHRTAIVVGPTGSDVSFDGGRHWMLFDEGSFDSVACAHDGACWASGEQGRAARLESRKSHK